MSIGGRRVVGDPQGLTLESDNKQRPEHTGRLYNRGHMTDASARQKQHEDTQYPSSPDVADG